MGRIEGVVATRSGWLERMEVVEVTYDPSRLPFDDLVKLAHDRECARKVFTRTETQQEVAKEIVGDRAVRSDAEIRVDDDKFSISRTPLRFLPLTPLQAARINALLRAGETLPADAPLLAPRQRRLLETILAHPDAGWDVVIGTPFLEAWAAATARAADRDG